MTQGWCKTSIRANRSSGSFTSILSIRSSTSGETLPAFSVAVEIYFFIIIFFSYSLSLSAKGYEPSTRACKMIPRLHTSIFGVELVLPRWISGAINFILPAVLFSSTPPRFDPKIPKSTTLIFMLDGVS